MALTDIAPVLAKDFVTLGIDTDRMAGGNALFTRYSPKGGGIPWFVFLDGDGRAAVTSDGPKGNVGFPAAPHEIAHFRTMLEQSKRRLTGEDVNALVASLEDANRK